MNATQPTDELPKRAPSTRRMRFSLTTLMLAVAILAVGFAVARFRWPVVPSAAGVVLWLGLLCALFSRQPTRAFWIGFEAFGWAYQLLFLAQHGFARFIITDLTIDRLVYDLSFNDRSDLATVALEMAVDLAITAVIAAIGGVVTCHVYSWCARPQSFQRPGV